MTDLGFPAWVRLTHLFNILFITLLIRSGIEILSSHPKLYWNDDCTPGSEWLRLTRKHQPSDRLWTSLDEEEPYPALIALPGGRRLGLGRHWHFASVYGWILTGLVYVVLLFTADQWRRLVPTSLDVFPQAWSEALVYLHFQLPPDGHPYTSLQQLAYFPIVFLLPPLTIATGLAMSSAIAGRFPWYLRIFGGKQAARSIHFICLVVFIAFTLGHTALVVIHGLGHEFALMALGSSAADQTTALVVGFSALGAIALVHVLATVLSRRRPRAVQRVLTALLDPVQDLLARGLPSAQQLPRERISPFFRVNGYPPNDTIYKSLADGGFRDWRLDVGGLVEHPARLSLDDLHRMARQDQVTLHSCIQGWTAVGEWSGVPLAQVIDACGPQPGAAYALVRALDDKSETHAEGEPGGGHFYEIIDLKLARHPQTILAYELNGKPLTIEHGAPLRLRVESELGFKMVKWITSIELIDDYRKIGAGQGGWREDNMFYSPTVGI